MYRIDVSTAVSSLPTPATLGTQGYFSGGNPGVGTAATVVSADWLNMIQEELIAIVLAATETPSKTSRNQVLTAIQAMISAAAGAAATNTQSNTGTATNVFLTPANFGTQLTLGLPLSIQFPGGLIMKVVKASAVTVDGSTLVTFGSAFPTAVIGAFACLTGTALAVGSGNSSAYATATTTGVTLYNDSNASIPTSQDVYGLVFGY